MRSRAAALLCALGTMVDCRRELAEPRVATDAAVPVAVKEDASEGRKDVPADAGQPTAREAFERVVAMSESPVRVFAAGSRVLVSQGSRFIGLAEPNKPYVEDASLSDGLPSSEGEAPTQVAGRWPNLLAIHGHFGGSGGDPAYHAFSLGPTKRWTRATTQSFERVWSVAMHGAGYAVFEPDSFHLENGMLGFNQGVPYYLCDATSEKRIAVAIGAPSLTAPASFFPMDLATDGSGRPVGWGYVACKPGVHALRLGPGARLAAEVLPGSEVCTERDPTNGFTLTTARLFPASDGGAFALVGPSVRYDEMGGPYNEPQGPPSTTCLTRPLRVRRAVKGGWAAWGAPLPGEAAKEVRRSAIDPAGTAFLTTRRQTVLRVDASGVVTELGLAAGCVSGAPPDDGPPIIVGVEAPFPDDVWVIVRQGQHQALCRSRS